MELAGYRLPSDEEVYVRPDFPAHLTGILTAALLAGCVVDPAEFLAVEMYVADAYNARRVLEQARPNQPLTVGVWVGNFGQEAVTVEVGCPPFRVINRSGEVVGPGPTSCAEGSASTVTLVPGMTRTVTSQWSGEGLDGTLLPRAAYGIEGWTRRVDRTYDVGTGVEWVCLLPDGFPPPNPSYHDCGVPGDVLPSRALEPSRARLAPQK
jgi:hypothetical protein